MKAIRNHIRVQLACVLRSMLALAVPAVLAVTPPVLAAGHNANPGIPPSTPRRSAKRSLHGARSGGRWALKHPWTAAHSWEAASFRFLGRSWDSLRL